MPSKKSSKSLGNWEILYIFIGFVAIVTLVISVYMAYSKESFYPVVLGPPPIGPWNYPTRYPIRGWGWDIRGYPPPYPITDLTPPNPANNTVSASGSNGNVAPWGIEMTPTKPTTTKADANSKNSKPSTAANNESKELKEDEEYEKWYEKESKWWPDWVRWPWAPYFNYGLHYDVNGKLKPANNESIVSNHAWFWW